MDKVHELFPLVIYQGEIENHQEYKKNYLEELKEYWFNGYQNESPECSGRIFLHKNKKYLSIFQDIKKNIDRYFYHLNVDYEKLDYHIIKSWVGCHFTDETPSIQPHYHNEANLSFVYYIKTDETSDKFVVQQKENNNQCVGGLFETAERHNLILGFNRYNCDFYRISPVEGSIIIMPSQTYHFTQKEMERKGERVVLVGDITVTLKEKYHYYHQGSTHPNQWETL
jgi:hypothetical protein